jgi:exosortase/archaeosortase family protein
LVRRPWARFLVIALAAPIALAMNFIRSLTLTLLANNHVDISGTWHDATGFAVLGLTAAILGALAVMLERERPPTTAPLPPEPAPRRSTRPQWALLGTLGAAAALVGFFVWNTRPSTGATGPVPNLAALLPDAADGWQTRSPNLYEFRGTLQTEHLAQRDYRRASTSGAPDEIVIYVAYWRAGQASVSLVASHTPDACWPGSGWTIAPNSTPRVALRTANRNLPEAEQRVFTFGDQPQHVWFWHIHDGRPIAYRDPYSAVELLKIAWKYGFRRNGDQLFVRVSSNRPWPQIADEPVLRSFFERVQKLGL